MIAALARSVAWILGCGVAGAALFWAFLNTPESTVITLALSLSLVVAMALVSGATVLGTLSGWAHGWPRATPGRVLAGLPVFLAALGIAGASWWVVGQGLAWMTRHEGEMGAWFIARLNWDDVRPLMAGVRLAAEWLRWVAIPFASLAWLAHVLTRGWGPAYGPTLRRAFAPWRLATVTAIAAGTIWAPLAYLTYWRALWLPPGWMEPAFAMAKFGLLALVAAIGLSLIARLAVASRS